MQFWAQSFQTTFLGQTGPCVYPAGYVYLYSVLYFLTEKGTNIFVNMKHKIILIIEGTNHFLLVSQLIIGFPFIQHDADAYFSRAFEFKRVFTFKWSVNWQFLGEEVATGQTLSQFLLIAHLSLLIVFLLFKWTHIERGIANWFKEIRLNELFNLNAPTRQLDANYVAQSMFYCNFIGIVCARSLHYQFYSWYFHTLPLILNSCTQLQVFMKVGLIVLIEVCWNIYPPNEKVSLVLFSAHVVILINMLVLGKRHESPYEEIASPKRQKIPIKFD
eukprot:403359212